ncbi:MAG: DUF302 domain-containing protein [Acidimicrobiales bacterium]
MQGITVTVNSSPAEAEKLTRAALADEGFGVLTEIDVAATLREKLGVDRPALKILGACNPQLAHEAIERDPTVSLLLPCNVVVEQTPDGVQVSAADPRQLLNGPALSDLAEDAAVRLGRALDVVAAAGS